MRCLYIVGGNDRISIFLGFARTENGFAYRISRVFWFVCLFGAFIGAIREIEVRTCYWVLDKIYIFIYGM